MLSPVHFKEYHVFLSSPGDMEKERNEVRAFFDHWNNLSWPFGIRLRVIGHDSDATVGVGHPQDLITVQTLERFRDSLLLFIGLMGQRFGTPTRNADSGTEEEFKWALRRWREGKKSGQPFPEIKMFFRTMPFEAPLNVADIQAAFDQYKKVHDFKEKCQNGRPPLYYREFKDNQFRQVVESDLHLWLSHPDRPWLQPTKTGLEPSKRPGRSSDVRKFKPVQVIPGRSFTEPNTDIKMLSVPEGRFQIGQGRKGSTPWVRLSSFWISETPVTNRQYAVFLRMQNHQEPEFWQDERYNDTQQPVVGVNWNDAMAFCSWLSKITDLKFSVCSEAQWEYAARGTDGRKYPWGNDPPTARLARYERHRDRPASAGSYLYSRGPFGTIEQAGNVWEWCLDVWHPNAYEKWKDSEPWNPVNTEGEVDYEDRRVLRGGCWIDPPKLLLAFRRYCHRATYTANRVGFRVVTNLTDAK
jgi:formylglycine-generating enzyme required for sulfatase activity